jgi:Flp pilus assembly protein TadG
MASTVTRRRSGPAVRRGAEHGQATVELALALPMLFLLIVLAIDFGGWLHAWIEVGNAARAVANYAALGPSSVGDPVTPNSTAITSMIASDLATLPNYSSTNPSVIVCWNQNGTYTAIVGTCSSPSADNEPATFTAISVDLTFTYTPLIPVFNFAKVGVHLPVIPTTIHRRIVMRFI